MENLVKELMPYPFEKNNENNEVYGKIIVTELSFYDTDLIRCKMEISLVNEKMLNYDSLIATDNIDVKDINPYFYEFSADEYIDEKLFYKLFSGYEINGIRINLNKYTKESSDFIFKKFKIYDEYHKFKNSENLISGQILFSASPIIYNNVTLEVIDVSEAELQEIIDKIKNNYKCNKHVFGKNKIKELKKELEMLLPNPTHIDISVFNVGQGNSIFINYGENGFFFDIGLTREKEPKKNESIKGALKEIYGLNPNIIFLSHWDLDHILGVTEANNSIYDCLWIAPNFYEVYSKVPLAAERLCAFLIYKKVKIFMLDNSFNNSKVLSLNENFILYKGKSTKSKHINKMNNYGFILNLKLKKSILLTGDCDYNKMPAQIFGDDATYNYFIVPHHGSAMSKPRLNHDEINNIEAIVSVGDSYGHPNEEHMTELCNRGYIIRKTKDLIYPNKKIKIYL